MTRAGLYLVVAALLLAHSGCGGGGGGQNARGGNQPAGPGAAPPMPAEPPVENRWPTPEAALAAAPAVPLTTQEVEWQGETFLIDLPAGANVIATTNDNGVIQAIVGADLVINFRVGHEDMAMRKDIMTKNSYPCDVKSFPYYDKRLLVIEHTCDKENNRVFRGYFHITDGYRHFAIWPEPPKDTSPNLLTLPNLLLGFKCGSTLRVKTPYPNDPLELAKRFKLYIYPEGLEATKASLPQHTSAGHLKAVAMLPKITEIDMQYTYGVNPLTDFAPLGTMANLKKLRVQSLDTTPEGYAKFYEAIKPCTQIEDFCIYSNDSIPVGIDTIVGFPELKILRIKVDEKSVGALPKLAKAAKLEYFDLIVDGEIGSTKALLTGQLAALAECPALRHVSISGHVQDDDFAELGKLTKLEELDITGQLKSPKLEALAGLAKLKRLSVARSYELYSVTAAGIEKLPPSLEELSLRYCKIDDASAAALAKLPALAKLSLWNDELTPAGLAKLGEIKTLKEIYFSSVKGVDKAQIDAFKAAHPTIKVSN